MEDLWCVLVIYFSCKKALEETPSRAFLTYKSLLNLGGFKAYKKSPEINPGLCVRQRRFELPHPLKALPPQSSASTNFAIAASCDVQM